MRNKDTKKRNTSTQGEERTHRLSKTERRDGLPMQIAAENIARASTHGGGGRAEHIWRRLMEEAGLGLGIIFLTAQKKRLKPNIRYPQKIRIKAHFLMT